MWKREELDNPDSCINKAAEDEPVFVLRAKDPCAITTINYWISKRLELLDADPTPTKHDRAKEMSKTKEAHILAMDMEHWRLANRLENAVIEDPDDEDETPLKECDNCKWMELNNHRGAGDETGECRFNPPVLVPGAKVKKLTKVNSTNGTWPVVSVYDWCSKHERADTMRTSVRTLVGTVEPKPPADPAS